jgi:hypothetical protein
MGHYYRVRLNDLKTRSGLNMHLKMMKQGKRALARYNKAVLGSVSVLLALGVIGTKAGAIPDVPAQYIVTPQQFGAKADGVTDDTDAIQKAINTVFARGGGIVFSPRGVYDTSWRDFFASFFDRCHHRTGHGDWILDQLSVAFCSDAVNDVGNCTA